MLAQLAAMAADDRLHPESVPVVEWLTGEVRAAGTSTRLDELAELAADPAAGIRRRRWWQDQPAAIEADGWDHDDDYQDGGQASGVEPRAAISRWGTGLAGRSAHASR